MLEQYGQGTVTNMESTGVLRKYRVTLFSYVRHVYFRAVNVFPPHSCLLRADWTAAGMSAVCTQGGLRQDTTPTATHTHTHTHSAALIAHLWHKLGQILVSFHWCCWPSVSHVCTVLHKSHVVTWIVCVVLICVFNFLLHISSSLSGLSNSGFQFHCCRC